MADITETNTWTAGVHLISGVRFGERVLGGDSGPANLAAIALANRTLWLRNTLAGLTATGAWVEVVQTATGDWECPAGVTEVLILEMCGGGGGGAGCYFATSSGAYGGAGGEGARVENEVLTVVPGTTYTLTIGAAGAAGGANVDHGSWGSQDASLLAGDGGDTSFGALLTCPGGKGAGDSANTWSIWYVCKPGEGGTVTFNGVTFTGQTGEMGNPAGGTYPVPPARGGGRLGAYAFQRQTAGTPTYATTYKAAGYGCGGSGGIYQSCDPKPGGPGIIRFAYPLVSLVGKPAAI